MKVSKSLGFVVAIVAFAIVADFAMAQITMSMRRPSQGAIDADAALADAWIYDIFATTTGDIVSLEDLTLVLDDETTTSIYTLGPPFGSDTQDNCPDFCGFDATVEADSYLTTPGDTNVLFNGGQTGIESNQIALSTWADFTDDGPQTMFQIGRITLVGADELGPDAQLGFLRASLQFVGSSGGVEPLPISLDLTPVPEPAAAALTVLGGLGIFLIRRRRK